MATSPPLKSPHVTDEALEIPNESVPLSFFRYWVQVPSSSGVLMTAWSVLVVTARLVVSLQTWSCQPPMEKFGRSMEFRWKLQKRAAHGLRAICVETCGEAR